MGLEALSELFEDLPVAISVTLGPEHRYAFANKLFRAGLSHVKKLIGLTLREALGARYKPETEEPRRQVLETGQPIEIECLPYEAEPGDEESFWNIRLLPVRADGEEVIGVLTIGFDITNQVMASRAADQQTREAAIASGRLSLAVEATELGFWDWDAKTDTIYWSSRQREIFGIAADTPLTHRLWMSAIHPEDREWVVRKVSSLIDPGSPGKLAIEYRIVRPDGEVRWISSRGRMLYESLDGKRRAVRLTGTILDITERRTNEEARRLLAAELDHRVKNLFAMAASMVTLTARSARSTQDMAIALRGRLEALARSHELIRPAITGEEKMGTGTSIGEILQAVLEPHIQVYSDQDPPARIFINGPFVPVGARAATSLTLVIHELATNAAKYGALSIHEGQIRIVYEASGDKLLLAWEEMNGPPVMREPHAQGFGSKLARKSITEQLGGSIAYDWRREGLRVTISLPLAHLSQ